jgi:hypothetical protein
MITKVKWFLFLITGVYIYFIIGPLKSPSPYRNNIIFHIIYILIVVCSIIIILRRKNRK